MSKGWIVVLVIFGLLFVGGCSGVSTYNGIVAEDEAVEGQWWNVENVYQRRADLIPNLVSTVKGYKDHELNTLVGVVEARAKATQTTIDAGNLTPEKIAAFQGA